MENDNKIGLSKSGGNLLMQALRIAVAALFIFSGLIKMNDPVGMSIKLEEYFHVFATDIASLFEIFIPFALPIAVFIVVLEVVLGIALLLSYRISQTLKLLLGLIVFFTILTFYSAAFNKVTDCGCFGDAIKLTPWQSFYKDIALLLLLFIIRANITRYSPLIQPPISTMVMGVALAGSVFAAVYAINHLPFIDFRPYKVGMSIPQQMEPGGELLYEYVMLKDGEEYRFDAYPADETYTYKDMVLLNPEVQPKITDYGVWNDEGDFTQETFVGKKLFIVVCCPEKSDKEGLSQIPSLVADLNPEIEVYALTSSEGNVLENLLLESGLQIPYYYADATVLKTIVRANPGIFLTQDGVIKGKWHYNDTPSAEAVESLLD